MVTKSDQIWGYFAFDSCLKLKKYSSGSKVRSRREQTEDGDAETSNRVAKCCADRRKVNLLTIWLSAQCLRLRSNLSPHLHRRLVCRAATGATSPAKGKRKKERHYPLLLFVPYDVLFSNEFLRDLSRLWSLRDIAPNPNNLPWVENFERLWKITWLCIPITLLY